MIRIWREYHRGISSHNKKGQDHGLPGFGINRPKLGKLNIFPNDSK